MQPLRAHSPGTRVAQQIFTSSAGLSRFCVVVGVRCAKGGVGSLLSSGDRPSVSEEGRNDRVLFSLSEVRGEWRSVTWHLVC